MISQLTELPDRDLKVMLSESYLDFTRAKAKFLIALGELDSRSRPDLCGLNIQAWITRTFQIARRTAREYLHTARGLHEWPELAKHFLEGEFGYTLVRLLLRYRSCMDRRKLLDLATKHTVDGLRTLLAGQDSVGTKTKERFSLIVDEETGFARFWGVLNPEHAAQLNAAIKIGELSYLRDLSKTKEGDEERIEELNAEEQTEAGESTNTEEAMDTQRDDAPAPPSLTRFGPPQHLGMLGGLLAVVNIARCRPKTSVRAPGAQVNVLVRPDGNVHLAHHHAAAGRQFLTSIIDGHLRYHVLERDGVHLALGRSQRVVNDKQTDALLAL